MATFHIEQLTSRQLPLRTMPLWTRAVCHAWSRPAWLHQLLIEYPLAWQWVSDDVRSRGDHDSDDDSASDRMQEVDAQLDDFIETDGISQEWDLMVPVYLHSMLQCPWFPQRMP